MPKVPHDQGRSQRSMLVSVTILIGVLFASRSLHADEGATLKTTPPTPANPPLFSDAPPSSLAVDAPHETARALLERAAKDVDALELEPALRALRAAFELEPSTSTACNRGLVASRLKLRVEAAEYLARCASGLASVTPRNEADDRRRIGLLAELALAKTEVATIMLTIEGATKAELELDGHPAGPIDGSREVVVEPGPHELTVHEGAARVSRRLDLLVGSTTPLHFNLRSAPLAPVQSGAAPRVPPPTTLRRDPRFIAGGAIATAISVALGLVFVGVSRSNETNADDSRRIIKARTPTQCFLPERDPECQNLRRYADSADAFQTYATASFVSGGISGLATLVFSFAPVAPFLSPAPAQTSAILIGGGRW